MKDPVRSIMKKKRKEPLSVRSLDLVASSSLKLASVRNRYGTSPRRDLEQDRKKRASIPVPIPSPPQIDRRKLHVAFSTPSEDNVPKIKEDNHDANNNAPPLELRETFKQPDLILFPPPKAAMKLYTAPDIHKQRVELDPLGFDDGWKNNFDFVLTCFALSLGLANVWRLPTEADNRGGFVLVWLASMFLVGFPLLFLEVALAYFSNKGPVQVWTAVPIFRGVGWCQVFVNLLYACYYPTIASFAIFYFTNGFGSEDWTDCSSSTYLHCSCYSSVACTDDFNITEGERCFLDAVTKWNSNDERFSYNFLLLPGVIAVILCVILGVSKGTQYVSQVLLLSSISCFSLLLTLLTYALIYGEALEHGLKTLVDTSLWLEQLKDIELWTSALVQAFVSLNLSCGVITSIASRNRRYAKNAVWDAVFIFFINVSVGLISIATVSSWKGIVNGPEKEQYVFAFSNVFSLFHGAEQIPEYKWMIRILVPLLIFSATINSMVPLSFSLMTVIQDNYTNQMIHRIIVGSAILLTIAVTLSSFGLPVINAIDGYGVSGLLLTSSTMFVFGFIYVYGRLKKDFNFWTGNHPSSGAKALINVLKIVPFFSITGLVLFLVDRITKDCPDKQWVLILGWTLYGMGIAIILVFVLKEILLQIDYDISDKFLSALRCDRDWGPKDPILQHQWHYYLRYDRDQGKEGGLFYDDDEIGIVNLDFADEKSTKF